MFRWPLGCWQPRSGPAFTPPRLGQSGPGACDSPHTAGSPHSGEVKWPPQTWGDVQLPTWHPELSRLGEKLLLSLFSLRDNNLVCTFLKHTLNDFTYVSIQVSSTHVSQDTEHLPGSPSQSTRLHPRSHLSSDCCHYRFLVPVSEVHIKEITPYVRLWLPSPLQFSVRSHHVVATSNCLSLPCPCNNPS